jgi:hypothetical protein
MGKITGRVCGLLLLLEWQQARAYFQTFGNDPNPNLACRQAIVRGIKSCQNKHQGKSYRMADFCRCQLYLAGNIREMSCELMGECLSPKQAQQRDSKFVKLQANWMESPLTAVLNWPISNQTHDTCERKYSIIGNRKLFKQFKKSFKQNGQKIILEDIIGY